MRPTGTKAARAPLTSTPRTRNGAAWTVTDSMMVTQVLATGPDKAARMAAGNTVMANTAATRGQRSRRAPFPALSTDPPEERAR